MGLGGGVFARLAGVVEGWHRHRQMLEDILDVLELREALPHLRAYMLGWGVDRLLSGALGAAGCIKKYLK